MNLATIVGVYLLGLACAISGYVIPVAQQSNAQASASAPAPAPTAQSSEPAQAAPAQSGQTSNPPDQAKPSAPTSAKRRNHRKPITANCSTAPTALNTAPGNSADPAKPADTTSTNATTTALPPCPTPRKVVRNGGSEEPAIQLVGGDTSGQTAQQRSIEELTAATEANLKRVEGHQLNPTQQDMRNQIRQFIDQSKAAIAAGDLERGNNLAMKAHLLSDELVKP